MRRLAIAASIPLLCLALGNEPARAMPSASAICEEIEAALPGVRFDRESHIRLGRIALGLLKPIARWALDEDDEARVYLAAIKKVEVASYRVLGTADFSNSRTFLDLEKRLLNKGWVKMVRSRDGDGDNWVFLRHREDGTIRNLIVIEFDRDELNIVGIEGRIDDIFAAALADEPGEISALFGS
jgi:hypothetical protein